MAAEAPEASMALAEQALMVKRVSEYFFNVSSLLFLRHSHNNPHWVAVSQPTYWDHPQGSPAGKINMVGKQERKAGVPPITDVVSNSNNSADCTARGIGNDTRSRVHGHRGSVESGVGRSQRCCRK
jgi:hypothetical protein